MKWLFIVDPMEGLDTAKDTTYAMMAESSKRKIDCYVAQISDLYFDKKPKTKASKITFEKSRYNALAQSDFFLDDFEMIFMRKEPPYDIKFHYATLVLSLCKTLVVNNPAALRDLNEKLIILNFPELIAKTIVSSDKNEIIKFIRQNGTSILKSLDSYQGKHISKVQINDRALDSTIITMTENGNLPIMVQGFIPKVVKGDKRILMLNGKILGAVNRVPRKGSFVSNFGQGGKGKKTTITNKDLKIADGVSGFLVKNGIHFAGLDVIDGYLTEINITCPTGIRQINAIENKSLEVEMIDYFQDLVRKK